MTEAPQHPILRRQKEWVDTASILDSYKDTFLWQSRLSGEPHRLGHCGPAHRSRYIEDVPSRFSRAEIIDSQAPVLAAASTPVL